ncbi:MAG TPA: hypothetical protein PK890_11260, partial [Terrimesophilobacter sp.]|nr:hypothetical protein [Terrimesophilobacter sp.]
GFFPDNIAGQLILCAVVVISIQWGRGRWLPNRLRWAPRASNIVAGIAVVMLTMMATAGSFSAASPVIVSSPYGFGLWYDGNEVQNIFAYDAAGQPLQFVQLYTEQGAPLTTLGARADDTWAHYRSDGSRLVPPVSDAGSTAWNVFPLYALAPQFGMNEGKATPPPLPFEQARPLVGADSLLQTCEVAAEADRPVDEQ